MSKSKHEVIVVGGGIAGLTAGYKLRHYNPLLLESEDVVGGRTLSRQLGPYVYNAGAQVILGNESPVALLADELGVQRTLIDKRRVPLFFRGRLYDAASQAGLLLKLPMTSWEKLRFALSALSIKARFASLASAPFDPADARVHELTSRSLDNFLGGLDGGLAEIWEAISTIADGEPPHQSTAFHPVMVMLHFLAEEYAVVGGTHQLTLNLAKTLAGRVEEGARVTSIRQTDDGVEVLADVGDEQREYVARKCVVAVQGAVAGAFVHGLPSWKSDALASLEYTAQTSAAFLLNVPTETYFGPGVWRIPVSGQKICALTDPSFFYAQEVKRRTGQGLIRVYTGHAASKALADMSASDGTRCVCEELDMMFPGIADHVVETDIHHWPLANTRWATGHLSRYEALQRPVGDLHFCGDYTSPGYMNGSVSSGVRAADEIESSARTS